MLPAVMPVSLPCRSDCKPNHTTGNTCAFYVTDHVRIQAAPFVAEVTGLETALQDMIMLQGAGTSAHVVLELFGGQGTSPSHSSGMHCLEQGPYQPMPFGPGQTDAFEVSPSQMPSGTPVTP